jgi:hypothetical protein
MRYERSVSALYLPLLNGNFMRATPIDALDFERALATALRELEERDIREMLRAGWRERLVAAWIVGLRQWGRFIEPIAQRLIESEVPYAGQGYCAALASMPNEQSRHALRAYLDVERDEELDEPWALAALEIVAPGDLWRYARKKHAPIDLAGMLERARTVGTPRA